MERVWIIRVKQHDAKRKVFFASTLSSPGSDDEVDFSLSLIIQETHIRPPGPKGTNQASPAHKAKLK